MLKNKTNIIISIVLSILFIGLGIILFKVSIIPSKYVIYILFTLLLLCITSIYLLFKINEKYIKIINISFSIILLISIILINIFDSKLNNIITTLTQNKTEIIEYTALVRSDSKDSDYTTINISSDEEYIDVLKPLLKANNNLESLNNNNLITLLDLITATKDTIILLKSSYIDLLKESESKVLANTKQLFKITIEVPLKDIKKEVDINTPFTVLISGIDTSGPINTVSRSDVNIIMSVNPKTYEIALIHIPRDYYVTFNSTGLKDKLTHTGIYGIEETVKTIENFMDININYYVKINFSTFLNLIDLIGNIEFYNPLAFSNGKYYYNEGNISLNSDEALIYSRSRKMLANGDIDRGLNQERVLEAIIKKLSNPNTAKNINNVINVMSDSFVTNLKENEIKTLINFELNHLPNWKITSTNIVGTGILTYGTPLYPNEQLYVMVPNEETVNKARDLIKKVKGE